MDALKRCALLAGFTPTGLAILAKVVRSQSLAAGQTLFSIGSVGDALYWVDSGKIAIGAVQDGSERQLCLLGPGESFGELGMLRPGKRRCTAKAVVPSAVMSIQRTDFAGIVHDKPQAGLKLMMAILGTVEARLAAVEPALLGLL